jgi:hypothetical protein
MTTDIMTCVAFIQKKEAAIENSTTQTGQYCLSVPRTVRLHTMAILFLRFFSDGVLGVRMESTFT